MTTNEIIRWCKNIWTKSESPPEESDEMNSGKPITVSGPTMMNASEPVGATGMTGAIGATGTNGQGEVQSG